MTISCILTRVLLEEHKHIPLPKEIHLLGRQTIMPSMEQINSIFKEVGVVPKKIIPTYDTATRQASNDRRHISDSTFFEIFGVESVRAIDHSDFEGADIVFDLIGDVPPQHVSSADFIFDGSVMDNIFDPASAMRNIAKILRPGGRYVGTNAGTVRWLPAYVAFNPYWFFDFFIANGFEDVKIYVCDLGKEFNWGREAINCSIFLLDANANHREVHSFPVSPGAVALVIIAEKGASSTSDERTSQGVYRLDDEWKRFDTNLKRVRNSKRPIMSFQKQADAGGAPGFLYIGTLNENGLSARSLKAEPTIPVDGTINLGRQFAGYGWGAVEGQENTSWRWIDDEAEEAVILVKLKEDIDYNIEALIHTARCMEDIEALQLSVNGVIIHEQRVVGEGAVHKLVANLHPTMLASSNGYIRIGLSVSNRDKAYPRSRSVALSRITFLPTD